MRNNTTKIVRDSKRRVLSNHFSGTLVVEGAPSDKFRLDSLSFPDIKALSLMAKRVSDFTWSLVLLILFAIPMLVIAVLVKLSSPGPIIYKQTRVGRGGREFELYKFRSMSVDAEQKTGPVWAAKNDLRPTRVGRFLRRFSLDELPQFINVLRGEMSLVGPRPERPHFVDKFSQEIPEYHLRHQMLPGLTGWAQVCGWRGDTSLHKRLECDLEYINAWSLKRDVYICLMTPLELLRGESCDR
jgi:exopolysaccharide biosynthesis polyprenyl glycosylphosphotransferase